MTRLLAQWWCADGLQTAGRGWPRQLALKMKTIITKQQLINEQWCLGLKVAFTLPPDGKKSSCSIVENQSEYYPFYLRQERGIGA